jgi:hypothetical protein
MDYTSIRAEGTFVDARALCPPRARCMQGQTSPFHSFVSTRDMCSTSESYHSKPWPWKYDAESDTTPDGVGLQATLWEETYTIENRQKLGFSLTVPFFK